MNPLFRKAVQAAGSARSLFASGDFDGTCDRAYYAVFNAVRTLLMAEIGITPEDAKTHQSTLRLFSEVFVIGGLAPAELGGELKLAQRLRAKADYSPTAASREDAENAIAAMESLLDFAQRYLDQHKGDDP
jgi:uncharacterized protein (UPF0332 family)